MGDGADLPDTPDYAPIIKAATEASKSALDQSKKSMDFFSKIYDKNSKVSDAVIYQALGQMDKAFERSDAEWNRYQGTFVPLEQSLAKEAASYATPERLEKEAGEAAAGVAQNAEMARQTALTNMEQYGIDPSQTRAQAMDYESRVNEGAQKAAAANKAREEAENIGRALRESAINVGKDVKGTSLQQLAAGAQTGQQAVNTGLAQTASAAQTLGTPTDWSQIGNTFLKTTGDVLNTKFGNELDKYKADQESSSGWGGILGNVAGSAMSIIPMLAEGGAIPDPTTDGTAIPTDASPSGGAIPDDVPASINGGGDARLNAGEFVVPKDVVSWVGEQGMQKFIQKARSQMGDPNQAPAQPEMAGGPPGGPPVPPQSVAAIPEPPGAM